MTWSDMRNGLPVDPEAVAVHKERMMAEVNDYAAKVKRSLTADDMRRVVDMMDRAEALTSHAIGIISDATITVVDRSGEVLCEVWWDSENEDWLADWGVTP